MDIRDGASKTFMAGEAIPQFCGWCVWGWFDGSTATCGLPLNINIPGAPPQNNSAIWQVSRGFMSRHRQGANFLMCDASVSYVNQLIDTPTYQALATIDGNESVTWPTTP